MSAPIPADAVRIEVRVNELKQLFNAMDAAPFRDRDLDPNAEAFILEWSRDADRRRPLALVVHLGGETPREEDRVALEEAVHEFFAHRAVSARHRLTRLFRLGRLRREQFKRKAEPIRAVRVANSHGRRHVY